MVVHTTETPGSTRSTNAEKEAGAKIESVVEIGIVTVSQIGLEGKTTQVEINIEEPKEEAVELSAVQECHQVRAIARATMNLAMIGTQLNGRWALFFPKYARCIECIVFLHRKNLGFVENTTAHEPGCWTEKRFRNALNSASRIP
jgi:hypothetical protein